MVNVLLLEDKIPLGQSISQLLGSLNEPIREEVVYAPEELFHTLENADIDVIVVENGLGAWNGVTIFERLQQKYRNIPFILCSKPLGDDQVVELLKKGITDYVTLERLDLLPGKIQDAAFKFNKSKYYRQNASFTEGYETLPGAFFELDYNPPQNPQIRFLSDNFFRQLDIAGGKTAKNIPLEAIMAFVPIDERDNLNQAISVSARSLNPINENFTVIIPGKKHTYIQVFATPRKKEDQSVIWHGIFYDVTAKVKTAKELADSNQKIDKIFDQIPDAVLEIDYTEKILYVNQNAEHLLRINGKEIIGQKLFESFPGAMNSPFYDAFVKAKKSGIPAEYNLFYEPLGSWVEGSICPHNQAISIYFRDITEDKLKNQQFKDKEKFLQLAVEAGGIGLWELDVQTGIVQDSWLMKVLGYPKDKGGLPQKTIFEAIHPEDRDKVRGIFYRNYYNFTNNFNSEFRIRNKAGEYLYIASRGKIVEWDQKGSPKRLVGIHIDLTRNKKNEEALENLSIVARKTHNGVIITDENQQITWVNKAFTKITGYPLREVKYKKPGDFLQGEATDKKYFQNIRKKIKAGKHVTAELINYKKDGTPFWVRMEITPVFKNGRIEKYIVILADVTKEKEDDQQLKLLENVVESSNDGVIITQAEPNGETLWPEIIYVNKAFKTITGFQTHDIKEASPSVLLGKETSKKTIQQLNNAFKNGKKIENDIIFYKKNGDQFWANFSLIPLKDNQKEITHFIFILRDVTHQKLDDIEKRQLITNLQNYNHTLEQYAFITSHNLRAPIAQIIGLTNLIQLDLDQRDLSKYIQYLQDSAYNLDQIIRDMNQLLNIRNNKSLFREKIDVKLLFKEIINKMPEDQKCQIMDLKINIKENFFLFSNKEYLEHILNKLLDNCVKFRKKDIPLTIQIDVGEVNDQFLLSITDNGVGFDAFQHRERIFRPYQHFNTELEGKGFGLSIVKAHVDALGGQIEVDSKEGKGTTFSIYLPQSGTPGLLEYSQTREN